MLEVNPHGRISAREACDRLPVSDAETQSAGFSPLPLTGQARHAHEQLSLFRDRHMP
jgi:hypothetical protein